MVFEKPKVGRNLGVGKGGGEGRDLFPKIFMVSFILTTGLISITICKGQCLKHY